MPLPQLYSLQQTRGQLLKVSEQMSCSLRSSQEHLASRLQQSQLQLEQTRAQAAHLQAQLHATQTSLQSAREALLIKVEYRRPGTGLVKVKM